MAFMSTLMIPKREPLDFSDAESIVDSFFEDARSPASSLSDFCELAPDDFVVDDECFTPHNFTDALFVGTQGIEYSLSDYKNNLMDYNLKYYNSPQFHPGSPSSMPCSPVEPSFCPNNPFFSTVPAKEPSVNMSWPNNGNNEMNKGMMRCQMPYRNLFQQAQMQQTTKPRDPQPFELFQMSSGTNKYKDLQQQVYELIKQQQAEIQNSKKQKSHITYMPPVSPDSGCGSTATTPNPCIDHSNEEYIKQEEIDNKLDCLDEDMLINTFKTLAEFVSNENIKTPVRQTRKPANVPKPKRKRARRNGKTPSAGKPRLYNFLREILDDPVNYTCIEWVDKSSGLFKFLDSAEVARLWGYRKNKPMMKYENFARSLRTYIAKGILTKPRNKLVYCFAKPLTA